MSVNYDDDLWFCRNDYYCWSNYDRSNDYRGSNYWHHNPNHWCGLYDQNSLGSHRNHANYWHAWFDNHKGWFDYEHRFRGYDYRDGGWLYNHNGLGYSWSHNHR